MKTTPAISLLGPLLAILMLAMPTGAEAQTKSAPTIECRDVQGQLSEIQKSLQPGETLMRSGDGQYHVCHVVKPTQEAAAQVAPPASGAQKFSPVYPMGEKPKSDADLLSIEVSESVYVNGSDSKPVGVVLRASVHGDKLTASCMKEDAPETEPCTLIEPGRCPGRFLHDWTLLEFMVKEGDHLSLRRFDVREPSSREMARKNPSGSMVFVVPNGKQTSDYPLMLHIYGYTTSWGKAGTIEDTSCSAGTVFTNMHCTTRSVRDIKDDWSSFNATLNGELGWSIRCTYRGPDGECRPLSPGIYAARWKDEKKEQLAVLLVDTRKNKAKAWEIKFFDASRTKLPVTEAAQPPD